MFVTSVCYLSALPPRVPSNSKVKHFSHFVPQFFERNFSSGLTSVHCTLIRSVALTKCGLGYERLRKLEGKERKKSTQCYLLEKLQYLFFWTKPPGLWELIAPSASLSLPTFYPSLLLYFNLSFAFSPSFLLTYSLFILILPYLAFFSASLLSRPLFQSLPLKIVLSLYFLQGWVSKKTGALNFCLVCFFVQFVNVLFYFESNARYEFNPYWRPYNWKLSWRKHCVSYVLQGLCHIVHPSCSREQGASILMIQISRRFLSPR